MQRRRFLQLSAAGLASIPLRGHAKDNAVVHGDHVVAPKPYPGHKNEIAQLPASKDGRYGTYNEHLLTRTYLLAGDREKALDHLTTLLRLPYFLSPKWLPLDPAFEPLRNDPRFQRLAAGS